MQPPRFSFFNVSIKHRLPLLIGALLLAILASSALASYRAVSASALEVGRERLVSLTEQLASQSQQSVPLLLSNTFTAANDPATRAFLQDPSPATRAGALAFLQQFVTAEDKSNLQVELWNANKSLALVIPNGAPESVDLSIEFKQCSVDPFRAVGAIRILKEVIAYPAVAAVTDGRGTPIGFLVRWRRFSSTTNTRKQIGDLLGSDAVLYYGNSEGNIWTDLEKVVPKPAGGLQSTLELKHYLHDGTPVMGMGRAIGGTPWFVLVEFPDHVFLKQANRVRRRMILIGLVLFVIGIGGAFSLSRTITQPLESLTNAALAVTRGDYSHTVDVRQGNELGDLASAFNVMVAQVGESKRELEGKVLEHERAKEAASKLAAIIESSDDAIIGKTLEGVVTSWNQGAEKLYGYSAEEVLGHSVSILVPPENTDELSNLLERLKRGERINYCETERITKAGKRIQVSFTVSPIRDSSGQITGASTIARDISERKMAQAAQQASDFRYRRLFESAEDGILILQENTGQIIDANPYLLKMLGYSCAEIAGKKLWEIGCFKDVAASKEAFAHLQKQGYIRYENLPLQTSDGHIRQVEFVSNRYLVGDEQVLQCNVRDITDRRQSEIDLKEANQSLELALKKVQEKSDELASTTQQLWQASKLATMGELAASVAHELNNPLATVALRAESALEGLPPEDPQRHGLEVISQEVDRMATLVGNLLVFSRRSVRQLSTLDLREELINSLNFIQYHLRSHKIDIVQEFSIDLPTVQADQQQVRQVFLNLITNACDAMPKGGTLTVRSRAGVMAGIAAVVVEFADTGMGVQTGDLPRLWEPFFTTKPAGKGTGLGLAICRRTVEEHRGTIEIETGPGKGTTVRITLPATGESLEVAA